MSIFNDLSESRIIFLKLIIYINLINDNLLFSKLNNNNCSVKWKANKMLLK